jgi:RNA polymerase sigma-70 factor, ECF subfamily
MPIGPSDDALAHLPRRIRDGDIDAFEQLFRAMHAPLCEVVDGYVRSQAIAEEIVQDLFLALWVSRDRFPAPSSMRAYLFASARNRSLHHLRHRAVARRWSERARLEPTRPASNEGHRPPDRALEVDETARALRRAVDQLPPRSRVAFVLQWEHEMSHADIAIAMGISIKGVEKLLATAKTKLRVSLGPHADAAIARTDDENRRTR